MSDALKCNGGAGYNNSAIIKSHNVKTRLVYKASATAAIQVAGDTSAYYWTWNNDFLMDSLYQPSASGDTRKTDGSEWCGKWLNELRTDNTATTIDTIKGLSGKNKCTYLLIVKDKSFGPTIQLSRADFLNFLIHWVEWINVAALGNDAVLNSNIQGTYQIGDYSSTDGSVFLNPLKTTTDTSETTWKRSQNVLAFDERDPSVFLPGSLGNAVLYPDIGVAFNQTGV